MSSIRLKVGQLAKRTGLTVRTLHYYEEVGLLTPATRTESGHRLYGSEEVVRLQQIVSLRQLGFSLEDISMSLDRSDVSLQEVLQLHLEHLRDRIARQQRLCRRLESIVVQVRSSEEVSVEELLQTIKAITMYEKYYTREQLDALAEGGREMGEERIRHFEEEWATLIAQVRAEMEKGTDPASETAQRLGEHWMRLVQAFTGGDTGIQKSLKRMYEQEGPEKASHGMLDAAVHDYVSRIMAAGKQPE